MIIFALATVVLVGMLALAVDVGFMLAERRQVQAAADSGAMAAARSLFDSDVASITTSGTDYAMLNAEVDADSVTVNWPPATGQFAGDDDYVELIIVKDVERFFLGAVYTGDWSVTARAVAGVENDPANYALLALQAPGIHIPGNARVILNGAGASAKSNSNITRSGVANDFVTQGTIDANGTINSHAGWVAPRGINPGLPVSDDPIASAGVVPPVSSTLPLRTTADISPSDCFSGPPKDCTLQPGHYLNLGNLTVRRTWTLQPGIYYFEGTSISFQNTNSTILGTGVMLYFNGPTNTTYLDPKNGNLLISAPSSTPYPGGIDHMALWVANCSAVDANGNTNVRVTGIYYAPCSTVGMHGTPGNDVINGQMIVGSINVVGNSTVNVTYQNHVETGRPRVFLVS